MSFIPLGGTIRGRSLTIFSGASIVDPALERIRKIRWHYADGDTAARNELERRLRDAARQEKLIPYSDLVRGITFNLLNVRESPLELGAPEWTDLHRAILGDFLGRISCDSYEQAGFLASAVAVSSTGRQPSEGFKALVKELGLASTHGDAYLAFWSDQVHKAQKWYKQAQNRETA